MTLMIAVFLTACASTTGMASNYCNKQKATLAEQEVGAVVSWASLQEFYRKYGVCDDGLISEGLSDKIGNALANNFGEFIHLAKQQDNYDFAKFVIAHIDETLESETLSKILQQAGKCSIKENNICNKIRLNAQQALNEL